MRTIAATSVELRQLFHWSQMITWLNKKEFRCLEMERMQLRHTTVLLQRQLRQEFKMVVADLFSGEKLFQMGKTLFAEQFILKTEQFLDKI